MKTHPVPKVSEGCPDQRRDTLGTSMGHPGASTKIGLYPLLEILFGTPGTPGTPAPAERDHPGGALVNIAAVLGIEGQP